MRHTYPCRFPIFKGIFFPTRTHQPLCWEKKALPEYRPQVFFFPLSKYAKCKISKPDILAVAQLQCNLSFSSAHIRLKSQVPSTFHLLYFFDPDNLNCQLDNAKCLFAKYKKLRNSATHTSCFQPLFTPDRTWTGVL